MLINDFVRVISLRPEEFYFRDFRFFFFAFQRFVNACLFLLGSSSNLVFDTLLNYCTQKKKKNVSPISFCNNSFRLSNLSFSLRRNHLSGIICVPGGTGVLVARVFNIFLLTAVYTEDQHFLFLSFFFLFPSVSFFFPLSSVRRCVCVFVRLFVEHISITGHIISKNISMNGGTTPGVLSFVACFNFFT